MIVVDGRALHKTVLPDAFVVFTSSGVQVACQGGVGWALALSCLLRLHLHLLPLLVEYLVLPLDHQTMFAPDAIIGVAYDSGGVTTSTITVPLVTALGVGLASAIKGRNPMIDGFGLIAFASLLPMMFVMVYGMVVA